MTGYQLPPLNGQPYVRPCGCRGEASARKGWIDHFACAQHMDAALIEGDKLSVRFAFTRPAEPPLHDPDDDCA